jgi:hypothetical protein
MPRSVDPSIISTGAGSASPGSVSQSALGPGEAGPSSGPLDAHLFDPAGAHPATAISIQDVFERYLAGNVEGALGELAALVPPAPGGIGSAGPPWLGAINPGVPDWGVLKLWDGALPLTSVYQAQEIYPYYWRSPVFQSGSTLPFTGEGVDPATDPTFNVVDGANTYTGGGVGLAHAGFATVSMGGAPADGYPSWRILPALPASTVPDVGFVVSGIVSPADRGVVALVRWPAGELSPPAPAASVADIQARCMAAIKLGLGLADGGGGCDGDPGGIFSEGTPTPYDFPGRASGQYELDEIHTGVARVGGTAPAANPAAGQVRLLTDPTAVTFSPATVVGGMPIFGATTAATGGGTDGNFLAYRLPYLDDYSNSPTGIKYTPATEKPRFYSTIAPASSPTISQAGSYDDFTTDFWAIQVARYRHRHSLGAATAVFRRDDSFALVHFRREAYFEEYVRDGIIPTADKLYSVSLVNWNGVAQLTNLVDPAASPNPSVAYSVNASEILEDPNGSALPALDGAATNEFVLSTTGVAFTSVSGVDYFVPRDPTLAEANPASFIVGITNLDDIQITNVFNAAYRSHDKVPSSSPFGDDRDYALNQNPVFLSLASFGYEGSEDPVTSTIEIGSALASNSIFTGGLGEVRRQRIELGYADMRAGATNPIPTDNAVIDNSSSVFSIDQGIRFIGDANTPSFTTDAKVRAFVRRPLVVDGVTGYPLPADPLAGFDIPNNSPGTPKILFHSMKETFNTSPTYGNAATPAPSLYTATKDREERFLDEVYRYPIDWSSSVPLPVPVLANLGGPGLPSGIGAIPVQVRPTTPGNYEGYYLQGLNANDLTPTNELQVAGLPERNPPYTDGLDAPFPSRGILLYPQKDYSTGYNPVGPDYSGVTGGRAYLRVFDAGAANVGKTSVILRVWGVELSDFAFAGGPGPFGSGDMLVALKIPGLTTYMNVGRVDGAGPSKQDPGIDGAGCQVIGPNTFDATDPASRIRYAQVEVNLGPLAPLFLNGEGKCPVVVFIVLQDTLIARSYNWENVLPTAPTDQCRGIVGLEILQ